jgi:hypothetical protein
VRSAVAQDVAPLVHLAGTLALTAIRRAVRIETSLTVAPLQTGRVGPARPRFPSRGNYRQRNETMDCYRRNQ